MKNVLVSLLILFSPFYSLLVSAQTINSIYFQFNKYKIEPSQLSILDSIIQHFNPYESEIKITAFADFVGKAGYNKSLSEKRAHEVKKYLITQGINNKDVTTCKGLGELRPETNNLKENKGIKEHRKAEIVVQEKNTMKCTNSYFNLKKGEAFRIPNLIFIPGKHIPNEGSYPILDSLFLFLKIKQETAIEIQGHICCETSREDGFDLDTKEYKLSFNRAKYVRDYLVEKGISTERISVKGLGRKHPLIIEEKNEDDRNKNRRVEIFLK